MYRCLNCGADMAPDNVFCRCCGARREEPKQPSAPKATETAEATASNKSSLFLKYSNYLDHTALFNVAYAKEMGIVKSDFPDEAEVIYEHLAIQNHLESMFRYAMIQLSKQPANKDVALKWLRLAASKGHVASENYLKTVYVTADVTPEKTTSIIKINHGNGDVLSGEEIFALMENSTVEIIAIANERDVYRASGFVVSDKGFVVTNAHAILDERGHLCKDIAVKLGNKILPAMPVAFGDPSDGKHDSIDIALLFIPHAKLSDRAKFGSSASCRNGQKVYLIGNSLGCGTCITSGIISDAERKIPGLSYPYIMTDAAANHGNSGGPLLNESGEVIGVLVSGIDKVEGMNYAIPIDIVKRFFAYLAEKTDLNDGVLGDLIDAPHTPSNMSAFTDKLFRGIHLVVDIIAFILSII